MTQAGRKYPIGAEVIEGGSHFRLWAPSRERVQVAIRGQGTHDLTRAGEYFEGFVPGAKAGTLYSFRLDGDEKLLPDPASRFQPEGRHGPSAIIDPRAFAWADSFWKGIAPEDHILYQMHIGTFTKEGTWAAARRELPELKRLGITTIQLMPVAEFAGAFGWGYDGVDFFAPYHKYGTPDDFRAFVNRAHREGLCVILDVVYNHLGPSGNYLKEFSPHYFTGKYETPWGDAINYDGSGAAGTREFVLTNVDYWITEFHLDGFRLDATQNIYDASPRHILSEISATARAAAGDRRIFILAENEDQDVRLIAPPSAGGYGICASYNDDFHHAAFVALTGRSESYYSCYSGAPQQLVSAAKHGFLFQGQYYSWLDKRRGSCSIGFAPHHFVACLDNHDQVANFLGQRAESLASPGCLRAMTALFLLLPHTPLLFQGQEFAASQPFHYFADHEGELGEAVAAGRRNFHEQFASISESTVPVPLPHPGDATLFEAAKLDFSERETHAEAYALHRDLLALRHRDRSLRSPARPLDGAVLAAEAFCIRFFGIDGDDRLLLVNLGRDLHLADAPEPLLAPPPGKEWRVLWSSENPGYGGNGSPFPERRKEWFLQGRAAVLLG